MTRMAVSGRRSLNLRISPPPSGRGKHRSVRSRWIGPGVLFRHFQRFHAVHGFKYSVSVGPEDLPGQLANSCFVVCQQDCPPDGISGKAGFRICVVLFGHRDSTFQNPAVP
jgi:hypothetical protein